MTGCVILASGEGKRFGGNKLLADFGGRPLIEAVLDVTEDLFEKRVLVTRSEEVAELCAPRRGLTFVLHGEPLKSDSVRLGLTEVLMPENGEAAERIPDHVLFFQGDQPLLKKATVRRMIREAEHWPEDIIRLSFRGEAGAPVLFPAWAFPELLALPAGQGGGAVIRAHRDRVRTVEAESGNELLDADTPEELRLLLALKANEQESAPV